MKVFRSYLFPGAMLLGLVASVVVIVFSLQAGYAAVPVAPDSESSPRSTSIKPAKDGRVLFVSKGCIVCHRHDKVSQKGPADLYFEDAPDLTHLKIDPEYIRRWLHDPVALKPSTRMPNLELSDSEIEALALFLTRPNE